MKLQRTEYGTMPDGTPVERFTLTNAAGIEVEVMTYGGILLSLKTPDRHGRLDKVTLYRDSLADYLAGHPHFGSLVGRFANRIARGRFVLDDKVYDLEINDPPNHLHGGHKGFDTHVWQAEPFEADDSVGVSLSMVSPDGDQGYPGRLSVTARYTLTDENELRIDFTAATDRPTVLNLTHHAYWNLAGAGAGQIYDHEVTIQADRFVPVDDTAIPLGELRSVRGSAMDLTTPTRVGDRIGAVPGGFDHTYVINRQRPGEMAFAARVVEPTSGRTLEVYTTQPGVQFYTGNHLNGSYTGGGVAYPQHAGLCLEAQHLPDSPNQPAFPSTVLRPGETFRQSTVHKFGVQK